MSLTNFAMLAADTAPASPAGQPQGFQQNPNASSLINLGLIVMMVVVFWLLMIRPQTKKAKEHAAMLKTLRPGDKVETNGGVVGIVVSVKEKTVSIRSAETKMEVLKGAISDVTERSGESESKES